MCTNCLSTAEATLAGAAFVGYAVKAPLHRALARAGLVDPPDPVAHDVVTVAFLRHLELDPVSVLGADVVAAAAAWQPARPTTNRATLLSPGSRRLATS